LYYSPCVALFIVQTHVVAQENTSSALTSEEQQEMLAIHNEWLEQVGTSPLKWSVRLSAEAEKWADTLVAKDKIAPNLDGIVRISPWGTQPSGPR
jgi:uncharacterized protein YkwD